MFRFALEPLLRHRRAVESTLRARYAAAARDRAGALRALTNLDAALADACANSKRAGDLAQIDAAVRAQAAFLERNAIACDRLRAALIEAARGRRAIELLRERRLAAYRAQRRRRDERDLDEANSRPLR